MIPSCDAGQIINIGACGRRQVITYTADACGFSTTCAITYNWTVVTAPVLANCGQTIDLGCNPESLPTCLTISQPEFGGASRQATSAALCRSVVRQERLTSTDAIGSRNSPLQQSVVE
ncbi:MAG: hypothetical protein IPM98_20255 [Lewinellaceae bacterium]|nr:hypothetical protein [Lewinellaceae bacterium]